MKRTIFTAAAILLLGLGFLFLLGASRHRTELALENAVETLYKADPAAADGMLAALLAEDAPNAGERGASAAEKLGYTERSYSFVSGRVIPAGWFIAGGALTLLTAAGVLLFALRGNNKQKEYEEELAKRVYAALDGDGLIDPRNGNESLIAAALEERLAMKKRTAEREAELRKYVENVAHELKNPTADILLELDLIEQNGVTPQRVERARNCAGRIRDYTSSLLSLARLRADKLRLEREPVELSELLESIKNEFAASGAEIAVETEGGPDGLSCFADRRRLSEALRNIMLNSIKHGGGSVKIKAEDLGQEVRIRVSDSGGGLTAGEVMGLFERYAVGREDGSSTGIGLSLAKEIAEKHSGKLLVAENEGGGTRFDLIIPTFSLKRSVS